jgi:hypothetical protein
MQKEGAARKQEAGQAFSGLIKGLEIDNSGMKHGEKLQASYQ